MMNKNNIGNKEPSTTEYTLEDPQNKCAMQEKQIDELTAKLNWYEEQIRLNKQRQFGASSEKTDIDQMSLFDEAEHEANLQADEPELVEITYKRHKQVGKKDKMPGDLPVERTEYRLNEDEQICLKCGEQLREMSQEIRREFKYLPPN